MQLWFYYKKRYERIIKNENIKWDDQYKNVDDALKNGKNIIITGGGGVGKSYMIKKLNEKYKIIITASTGTAAININGVTIHNLLRIFQNEKMLLKYDKSDKKYHLNNYKLETYDFICTDEISMIDGCTFDNIIERIKFINKYRKNDIKLIIVGDCMQLPPVENLISGYYFNGGEYDLIHKNSYFCSLSEVKRQDNIEFIEILKRVRTNY